MKFNKKKLTKKVKSAIKFDTMSSLAMVSIMINIFFFSGIVLFNATTRLDVSLYNTAFERLCERNYTENLQNEIDSADDPETAKAVFEVECRSGGFKQYYDNAVEAYLEATF